MISKLCRPEVELMSVTAHWNMVCGINEKFDVFDLACGFLNNSLKALAHFLPT